MSRLIAWVLLMKMANVVQCRDEGYVSADLPFFVKGYEES